MSVCAHASAFENVCARVWPVFNLNEKCVYVIVSVRLCRGFVERPEKGGIFIILCCMMLFWCDVHTKPCCKTCDKYTGSCMFSLRDVTFQEFVVIMCLCIFHLVKVML